MYCEACFENKHLIQDIRRHGSRSTCPTCGSKRVHVVADEIIAPKIQHIASVYEPVDPYDPLTPRASIVELIQEDWGIFSYRIADDPERLARNTKALLYHGVDLSDDHPDYKADWRRTTNYLEGIWHEACERLLMQGTSLDFGPDAKGFPNPLEVALEDLSREVPRDTLFYRARIHEDRYRSRLFEEADLGAPPAAKAGRANKEGESVLYVATDLPTAIAEVRPWRASAVAVAQVRSTGTSRIVDLVEPRSSLNPFTDELLRWRVQLAALFERLSYELSLPVSPKTTERDYAATQELCRVIKGFGYDGVKYRSSAGPGHNVAFFDVSIGTVEAISYCAIHEISYKTEKLDASGPFYESTPYDYIFAK